MSNATSPATWCPASRQAVTPKTAERHVFVDCPVCERVVDIKDGAIAAHSQPLNRADLDRVVSSGCAVSGCEHHGHASTGADGHGMLISSACHVGGGLDVEYLRGNVIVRCLRCKKLVLVVRVASAPTQPVTVRYTTPAEGGAR